MSRITAAALRGAVIRMFYADALAAEEALQGRDLTKNERTAFQRGLARGMDFDLFRSGNWEKAAESLKKAKP